MSNGNTLVIEANASAKNIYIASAKLNGKTINKVTITHNLISNGGVLDFRLTDKTTTKWITLESTSLPVLALRMSFNSVKGTDSFIDSFWFYMLYCGIT